MAAMRIAIAAATLAAVAGCATARTNCPLGTELARRIYSGGAEAEYCRRPDGIRQGPETRYFESGAEHVSGEYLDGAQSGVWRSGSATAATGAPSGGKTARWWGRPSIR